MDRGLDIVPCRSSARGKRCAIRMHIKKKPQRRVHAHRAQRYCSAPPQTKCPEARSSSHASPPANGVSYDTEHLVPLTRTRSGPGARLGAGRYKSAAFAGFVPVLVRACVAASRGGHRGARAARSHRSRTKRFASKAVLARSGITEFGVATPWPVMSDGAVLLPNAPNWYCAYGAALCCVPTCRLTSDASAPLRPGVFLTRALRPQEGCRLERPESNRVRGEEQHLCL